MEGATQIVLRVGMAAREAGAAVAQHGDDQGGVCAAYEKFACDPSIRYAPVWGGIVLPDAQAIQGVPVQGCECGGIDPGGRERVGSGVLWKRGLDRRGVRSVPGEFDGSQFEQRGSATGQTGVGMDQFHPRRQTVSLEPMRFSVGESGQSSEMPPIGAGAICRIHPRQPFADTCGECGKKRFRTHANPGLPSPGTGRNHHARLMALCPQTGEDAGNGIIEIQQNVTGIVVACYGRKYTS